MEQNSLSISKDGTATLKLDAPIVVDAIAVSVGFMFSAHLEAGMQISTKVEDWVVSGKLIFDEFRNAWNEGKIDLSKEEGIFDFGIRSPKLGLAKPFNGLKEVEIDGLKAVYRIKRTYFLGYSSMFPSSAEVDDLIANSKQRVFEIKDLFRIKQFGFKEYDNLADLPKQQAEVIQFRLVPKLDQSLVNAANFSATRISD